MDDEGGATELRLREAIERYHSGEVSQEKAAQLAGLTRLQFLELLAARELDVFVVDWERLDQELERR